MKRKFLILCSILLVVYTVFTLLDKSEYRVEKKLWRMSRDFESISQDPKAVPARQFEKIITDYRNVIKKYPDSRYVPQVYSQIGTLYMIQKKYDDARQVYGQVVTDFSDDPVTVSKALMDIGNSYLIQELMRRWIFIRGYGVTIIQRKWDS